MTINPLSKRFLGSYRKGWDTLVSKSAFLKFALPVLCSLLSNKTSVFYLILTKFAHDLIESWVTSLISPQMNWNRKIQFFQGYPRPGVNLMEKKSHYKMLFTLQNYTKTETRQQVWKQGFINKSTTHWDNLRIMESSAFWKGFSWKILQFALRVTGKSLKFCCHASKMWWLDMTVIEIKIQLERMT